MIGSRLLGQQPTFRGADFAIPEVALFGYYQFRSALATSDTWEQHDGIEILFMRSGEACWDLEDENLAVVNGGQALLLPAGMRHRIANGLYTPCRLFWMVFHAKDLACAKTALFRKGEIEALFEIAARQDAPIDLPEACGRNLSDLCSRLTDERLMIGSASIMAEVRSKIYSSVIELWETCASGHDSPAHSQLVRRAAALLRESAAGHDCDERDERIGEVAKQLGYGKSRLYSLFSREVGMAPNDYRQRVRIKRCCEKLARTEESITSIAMSAGFGSSQYFSESVQKIRRRDADGVPSPIWIAHRPMSKGDYQILDRRFERLINPMAKLERLSGGGRWLEGPVYFPAGRYLLWSDVPEDRILRYDENDGHVSVFRHPSHISNGATIDRQGRLLTCEHETRRVSRTEHDGRITTVADAWRGKRLNSPNDVVVKSDGAIWFTDPSYGIVDDYLGRRAESEIDGCNVYRVDPSSGDVTLVADDFVRPNGLAFSPDETKLYIVDSGRTLGPEHPAHIRSFDVKANNILTGGAVLAECTAGVFDGLRVDEAGNLLVTSAEGIHCHEPGGELIGKILVPETASNCAFGGQRRNRLFITAANSLYAIYLTTNGL